MATNPWFHGNINRHEAESLLNVANPKRGCFLIRVNNHFEGDFSLSVVYQDTDGTKGMANAFLVEHYRIKHIDGKYTIDDEEYFENLKDLVLHYKADADGLVTNLTEHVVNANPSLNISPTILDKLTDKWQLKRENLVLGELIGKGNFSEVFIGDYKSKVVAVKIIKDKETAEEFLLEADVMTTLEHPNLVCLLGVVLSETIYIVTEYMSKGSLIDYLRSRGRSAITPKELINFAKDTCSGMAYLESRGIIHRDLAARNILLHETGNAKVADFGLARPMEDHHGNDQQQQQQTSTKIAVKWTAPEACTQKVFSSKSDVWSFGILLWEIYSFGRVPYPKILLSNVLEYIEKGNRMEPPENCPPKMYDMMKKTWNISVDARPSFKELQQELLSVTE